MTCKSNTVIIRPAVLFLSVLFISHLYATPSLGIENPSTGTKFTITADNESLGTVLKRISQKTGWKIKAPEKWKERRITQTLTEVTLEAGLRSVLQGGGIENLLLTYDENIKEVNIFDTDIAQQSKPENNTGKQVNGPDIAAETRPSVVASTADPLLRRQPKETGYGNLRAARMARRRGVDPSDEE